MSSDYDDIDIKIHETAKEFESKYNALFETVSIGGANNAHRKYSPHSQSSMKLHRQKAKIAGNIVRKKPVEVSHAKPDPHLYQYVKKIQEHLDYFLNYPDLRQKHIRLIQQLYNIENGNITILNNKDDIYEILKYLDRHVALHKGKIHIPFVYKTLFGLLIDLSSKNGFVHITPYLESLSGDVTVMGILNEIICNLPFFSSIISNDGSQYSPYTRLAIAIVISVLTTFITQRGLGSLISFAKGITQSYQDGLTKQEYRIAIDYDTSPVAPKLPSSPYIIKDKEPAATSKAPDWNNIKDDL